MRDGSGCPASILAGVGSLAVFCGYFVKLIKARNQEATNQLEDSVAAKPEDIAKEEVEPITG